MDYYIELIYLIISVLPAIDTINERVVYYDHKNNCSFIVRIALKRLPDVTSTNGILITENKVLTSCNSLIIQNPGGFRLQKPKDLYAIAGCSQLNLFCQKRNVYQLKINKDCKLTSFGWQHDYGVVIIRPQFMLNGRISLAPMYPVGDQGMDLRYKIIADNTLCQMCGWGFRSFESNDNSSRHLGIIPVVIYDWDECDRLLCLLMHKEDCELQLKDYDQLCGQYKSDFACDGELGTSLICSNYVYGISSTVPLCSTAKKKLVVFSTLKYGEDWVKYTDSNSVTDCCSEILVTVWIAILTHLIIRNI